MELKAIRDSLVSIWTEFYNYRNLCRAICHAGFPVGFLDLRITPWIRNLLTRSLAIIPSLIVAIVGGSAGAGKLIIIASMILSFVLPFALVPLLKFTSCKTKMGPYANSSLITATTWVISSLVMAINTYYLVTGFIKLLLHSGLHTTAIVFAGIFGFGCMLVYLAAIFYLIFRKNRKTTQPLLSDGAELGSTGTNASIVTHLPREDITSMQLP